MVNSPAEDPALTGIYELFKKAQPWQAYFSDARIATPAPNSDVDADDQACPSYPISTYAWRSILVSLDHLATLEQAMVVRNPQINNLVTLRVGVSSPFTLIRGVLENAAAATWLLAPHDRGERIARRLRLAFAEAKDQANAGALWPHIANTVGPLYIRRSEASSTGSNRRQG